jgi:hypothetical protein
MKTKIGDMMREILSDYHEYIGHGHLNGSMYVKRFGENTLVWPIYRWSICFHLIPFGSYKHVRKEYTVKRSYDDEYWEFSEIPF